LKIQRFDIPIVFGCLPLPQDIVQVHILGLDLAAGVPRYTGSVRPAVVAAAYFWEDPKFWTVFRLAPFPIACELFPRMICISILSVFNLKHTIWKDLWLLQQLHGRELGF
jgi:hypothetical protein